MRRADRLFQIVHLLQARRTITARELAAELGVTVRTIYRDVADLADGGVPVEGEAGVGYRLQRGFQLPPLTFDREEIESLVVGARMTQSFADPALAEAARRALVKIEAVVPPAMREILLATPVFAPRALRPRRNDHLELVRDAIGKRRKLRFSYTRPNGEDSNRVVRPVGVYFWGTNWSVAAWCELRQAWRSFRLDRVRDLQVLGDTFDDDGGTTLAAWVRHLEPEAGPHVEGFGEQR